MKAKPGSSTVVNVPLWPPVLANPLVTPPVMENPTVVGAAALLIPVTWVPPSAPGTFETREIPGYRREGEGEAVESRGVSVPDDRVRAVDSQRLGKGRIRRVDDVGESLSMGGAAAESSTVAPRKSELFKRLSRFIMISPLFNVKLSRPLARRL